MTIYNGIRILSSTWVTNQTCCIGFVLGKDLMTGAGYCYVGCGWGRDKKLDELHVLQWGTKLKAEVYYAVDYCEQEKIS